MLSYTYGRGVSEYSYKSSADQDEDNQAFYYTLSRRCIEGNVVLAIQSAFP
jgi:hypothetical protein